MKMDKAWGWIIDPKYKMIQHKLLQVDDNLDTLRTVIDCKWLESVTLTKNPLVCAFCDEEGRLTANDEEKRYFSYQWLIEPNSGISVPVSDISQDYRQNCPINEIVFCNTVVIFGVDDNGNIQDAPLNISQIASGISFLDDDYKDEPSWEYYNLSELH